MSGEICSNILGPDGRPIVYPIRKAIPALTSQPYWPKIQQDVDKLITRGDQDALSSMGLQLYMSSDHIHAMVDDKATAAVVGGFVFRYTGLSKEYKAAFKRRFTQWAKRCTVAGFPFVWELFLWLVSTHLDHSGGVLIQFLKDPSGEPLINPVPVHRVRFRGQDKCILPSGRFAGYLQQRGIIKDKAGTHVGYCLLGDTAEDDQQVSTDEALYIYEPSFFTQAGPIPSYFSGLSSGKTALTAQEAENVAMIANSYLTFTRKTPTGVVENDEWASSGQHTNKPSVLPLFPGAVMVEAEGEELKVHKSERPGDAWESYHDRIKQSTSSGFGWPEEMISASKSLNANQVRSIQGRARRAVKDRQGTLIEVATRCIVFAVSCWVAMEDELPEDERDPVWNNPPSDFLEAYDCNLPPQISIDDGRDAQADREDLKLGVQTFPQVLAKNGINDEEAHIEEMVDFAYRLEQKRREKAAQYGFEVPMDRISLNTANPSQQQTSDPASDPAADNQKTKK